MSENIQSAPGGTPLQHRLASQHPAAVAQRLRYLTDDGYAERAKQAKLRYRAKVRTKKAEDRHGWAAQSAGFGGKSRVQQVQFRNRVQFHASRGRTPEDIVIREGWGARALPAVREVFSQLGLSPAADRE